MHTSCPTPEDQIAQARTLALGPANRLAAAQISDGLPAFSSKDFREELTSFTLEGVRAGKAELYRVALEGAADLAIAHHHQGRRSAVSVVRVLEEAQAQVAWALDGHSSRFGVLNARRDPQESDQAASTRSPRP